MLDPWIIERIRQEERERQERERPALQLPLPQPEQKPQEQPTNSGGEQGVTTIDYTM